MSRNTGLRILVLSILAFVLVAGVAVVSYSHRDRSESATKASDPSGTHATDRDQVSDTPRSTRARGWASLYAVAFLLMLAAAATMGVAARGFLASTTPLWVSTGLSAGSIVLAIASLVLPRRR